MLPLLRKSEDNMFNRMRHYTHYFLALVGLLCLAACGGKRQKAERIISVTIEPQRYFAERIAGEHFAIHCVVPAGQSPETYDPTPQQMVQIGESEAHISPDCPSPQKSGYSAWKAPICRRFPAFPLPARH